MINTENEIERCEICKFSKPHNDGQHIQCCFNPPVVTPSIETDLNPYTGRTNFISQPQTSRPIVAKNEWCGKFLMVSGLK